MDRTKLWVTGVLAVAAAATAIATTPASAAPKPVTPAAATPGGTLPAGFTDWAGVYRYQEQLNSAAGRITAADPGNASIVAAPGNHELRVYWKGPVPAAVRTLASTLGVKITFHPAAYTHQELVKQAQRLVADPRVFEAAPAADGNSVTATVAAGLAPAAKAGLLSAATVPLTVAFGQRPTQTFSRQGDTAPYWGGARYFNSSGNTCTTGIPLVIGDASAMQSAGHCADQFSAVTVPGVPGIAGTVLGKQTCKDTLLINFTGGVSQGVYTGDQNSGTSAIIKGATFDFVGNLTSAGGASSGEHLNIPVQAVDLFTSDSGGLPCGVVGPLTKAGYSSATCAVALGDSGGPAYSRTADGQGVLVRGTISLAVGVATCPGSTPNGFNTVYWAPAVRPSGSSTPGTLDFYRAMVPYVTTYFVTGTWTDGPGRGPGPKINVFGDTIEVDMSAFHRPAARGSVLTPDVIMVTFPDDRPHVGNLISPTQIRWDNGSVWTKL